MDLPFLLTVGPDDTVTGLLILDESCIGCLTTKAGETTYRSPTLAKPGDPLPANAIAL